MLYLGRRGLVLAPKIDDDFSYKLLLRPDRVNKRREIAIQLRLQHTYERTFIPRMSGFLQRRAEAASRNVERGQGQLGIDFALVGANEELSRMLRAHYISVMNTFGFRVLDAAKAYSPVLETKDVDGSFTSLVTDWIERNAAKKVVAVNTTTKKLIREALFAGEAEGDPLSKIAKRIRESTAGRIGKARSRVIARTETHAASNAAQDIALHSMGLDDLEREWLAVEDERTRLSHAQADGQRRRQGEPFDIGGALLEYPGDPSGPPEEIINCRCVLASVIP